MTSHPLLKAVFYMVLSAAAFTAINAIVREVDHLPTFELVFFRSIGTVVCCLFILIPQKIPIWGNQKKWLLLRAVVGFISMSLFFKAMQMMPLGSAVSLRYLSPFFAAILAVVLLRERMQPIQWIFLAMAFAGVALLKGVDTRISMAGLGVILLSAFFSGMVYVLIRFIGDRDHPVVIVNYFLTVAAILSGIVCLFVWTPPQGIEWLLLAIMGVGGFFAQLFMTKAMQMAESNAIAPFKYVEVVMTILVGWWLYGEYQTALGLVAMALIIAAILANVWVKYRSSITEAG